MAKKKTAKKTEMRTSVLKELGKVEFDSASPIVVNVITIDGGEPVLGLARLTKNGYPAPVRSMNAETAVKIAGMLVSGAELLATPEAAKPVVRRGRKPKAA